MKTIKFIRGEYFFTNIVIAFIAGLILFRLWGGAYSGGDEGYTAAAAYKADGVFNASRNFAIGQGRFYQLYCYTLAQIPYLFDSLAWTNFCRIFSSGLALVAFYLFSRATFGKKIAHLSILIYLGLAVTTGGGYNPFHALPLWFNFGMACIFLSFYFFVLSLQKNKNFSFQTALFFILGMLTYETMIFYVVGFPGIYIIKNILQEPSEKFSKFNFVLIWRNSVIKPLLLVISYLILYICFRKYYGSSYDGVSTLNFTNIEDFFFTIFKFSLSGILIKFNLVSAFLNGSFESYSIAIILLIFIIITLRNSEKSPIFHDKWIVYVILFLLMISSNVLFGLTPRYREWVLYNPFYLGSYFSGFFFAILLSLFVDDFNSKSRKTFALFVLAPLFLVSSIINQVDSINFFSYFKSQSIKWELAQNLSTFYINKNLSDKSICTNTFIQGNDPYDYWSYYLSRKIGKPVNIIYDKDLNKSCDLYINFSGKNMALLDKNSELIVNF